eukprot:6183175-Pleurochrysis_carterae.AAC.4
MDLRAMRQCSPRPTRTVETKLGSQLVIGLSVSLISERKGGSQTEEGECVLQKGSFPQKSSNFVRLFGIHPVPSSLGAVGICCRLLYRADIRPELKYANIAKYNQLHNGSPRDLFEINFQTPPRMQLVKPNRFSTVAQFWQKRCVIKSGGARIWIAQTGLWTWRLKELCHIKFYQYFVIM